LLINNGRVFCGARTIAVWSCAGLQKPADLVTSCTRWRSIYKGRYHHPASCTRWFVPDLVIKCCRRAHIRFVPERNFRIYMWFQHCRQVVPLVLVKQLPTKRRLVKPPSLSVSSPAIRRASQQAYFCGGFPWQQAFGCGSFLGSSFFSSDTALGS